MFVFTLATDSVHSFPLIENNIQFHEHSRNIPAHVIRYSFNVIRSILEFLIKMLVNYLHTLVRFPFASPASSFCTNLLITYHRHFTSFTQPLSECGTQETIRIVSRISENFPSLFFRLFRIHIFIRFDAIN